MARKMKTMDGNNAAAYVSYAFTDVAAIYLSLIHICGDKACCTGRCRSFRQPWPRAESSF